MPENNMTPMLLVPCTPEELVKLFEQAAMKIPREVEFPKSRTEIMAYLKIKDVKTFNNRVRQKKVLAKGQIGREPAYFLSHFFEK